MELEREDQDSAVKQSALCIKLMDNSKLLIIQKVLLNDAMPWRLTKTKNPGNLFKIA